MSKKIIQLNEGAIKEELKELLSCDLYISFSICAIYCTYPWRLL